MQMDVVEEVQTGTVTILFLTVTIPPSCIIATSGVYPWSTLGGTPGYAVGGSSGRQMGPGVGKSPLETITAVRFCLHPHSRVLADGAEIIPGLVFVCMRRFSAWFGARPRAEKSSSSCAFLLL